MEQPKPTYSISASMTVQVRAYEPVNAFVSLNGLTGDETDEQIQMMLCHSKVSFQALKASLLEKIEEMKKNG